MPYYAGLDCSGTPDVRREDAKHDPYTVCVAAVEVDREPGLLRDLATIRIRYRLEPGKEYRGHAMSDSMQADVVDLLQAHELRVGALLVSKRDTRAKWGSSSPLPSPTELQMVAARAALEPILRRCCLARLRCDEDIQGRQQQRELTTQLLRIHRVAWPGEHLKVRFLPSGREPLIQLADVVAYGLSCYERGTIRTSRLRGLVEALRADERHIITGPVTWDPDGK